jgi:predicted nucleic acid-binding protein
VVETVLLDAGPLGMISHPRPTSEIVVWLSRLLAAGVKVLVPEVADYEVRRELLRARRAKGVKRLDDLKVALGFVPITSAAMLQAAQFWAEARRKGRPTAHHESLDADAILAAQAATMSGDRVVIASTNPKHLARFVPAKQWNEIDV